MALLGGGLIGALIRAKQQKDLYNHYANCSSTQSVRKTYECKYCGMKMRGTQRPSVGRCQKSPYGGHDWREF